MVVRSIRPARRCLTGVILGPGHTILVLIPNLTPASLIRAAPLLVPNVYVGGS